jgi:murein DD-endopeptidase MepM/ murein hydrolase activator NlpD
MRIAVFLGAAFGLSACGPRATGVPRDAAPEERIVAPWIGLGPSQTPTPTSTPTATLHPILRLLPPTRGPGEFFLTPTPDPPRRMPPLRTETVIHVVQPGESVGSIASLYSVGPGLILSANGLANPNYLYIGQVLIVPPPNPEETGPEFKIIPDSELVYGPASSLFDVRSAVALWDGHLNHYAEEVEGRVMDGPDLVQLAAQRYSVNPRLLLALLEYQGGWVTHRDISYERAVYPLGYVRTGYEGLFSQLSWVADELNAGFYRWRTGWAGPMVLMDGSVVPPGVGINAGTAALEWLFAGLYPQSHWREVVGEEGFYQEFVRLFGIPFDFAVEPVYPDDLEQPELSLPFEDGVPWSFTSGPHSAWGVGSAWAALDFAPPGDALGCVLSNAWVVASADGRVLRADQGEVILDLDDDGLEQTGWVILYMHVESRDRVQAGEVVHRGDRIGHPSCEGGISNGTHVHIARRYNGEWIPADGDIPFNLDGWVSAGYGDEYNGTLTRGDDVLDACACKAAWNQIWR